MTTNSTNILLKKQGVQHMDARLKDGTWHVWLVIKNDGTYYGVGDGKTHSAAVRVAVRSAMRERSAYRRSFKKETR